MNKSIKVIAYVDGFNLYHGLKEMNWRRYYWLDIPKLCRHLLEPGQHLLYVKYFTSHIKGPDDKRKRQSTYLEALNTLHGMKLYYGKYQLTPTECPKCNYRYDSPEEKMTDVQLATQLVADALTKKFDTALLLSGDIDLLPAVEVVREECPAKRIIAVFPPKRYCDEVKKAVHGYLHVTEQSLQVSLLPKEVPKVGGYILRCPLHWH